ncbi:MAG: substrate-binding domain-containing protein [Planctomycetota bacterium]
MAGHTRVARVVRITHAYGRGVMRGAIRYMHSAGQRWTFIEGSPRSIDSLARRDVAGALLQVGEAGERQARECGIAAVNVSSVPNAHIVPHVGVDNVAVGAMAAEHLLDRGFESFAFAGGWSAGYRDQRIRGFVEWLRRAGVKGVGVWTSDRDPEMHTGLDGVHHNEEEDLGDWLLTLPKPTGLLAVHDRFGVELIELCNELDIDVPHEIAVVGVDNDDLACELSTPPLSSVMTSAEQVGFTAAEQLHRLMKRGPEAEDAFQAVHIPPIRVAVRESSDTFAMDDEMVHAAMRWIGEHADKPINVEDVVAALGVNRRTLEMRTRKALGRTPLSEIHRQHIQRAKSILADTEIAISQVADQAGFRSPQRFAVVFSRVTGMTPSEYRKQYRPVLR